MKARLLVVAVVALVLVGVAVFVLRPSDDREPVPPQPSADAMAVRNLTAAALQRAFRKESAADRQFFAGGLWRTGNRVSIRKDMGPGIVAGALGALEHDPEWIRIAVETVDVTVGRYSAGDGTLGTGRSGLDTMFIANQIGTALYLLGPAVGEHQRVNWTNALRRAADYLFDHGYYDWYTNGNVVLGNTLVAAWAWLYTADPKYRFLYLDGLRFAEHPPAGRWPGRGLVLSRAPTRADGADGAGYLTEAQGDGPPGFDADYTQIQADAAATLYLITADPGALRLANILVNQLLPRVNRQTWQLDTSHGSRHREPHREIGFSTSALTVLARSARPDLAAYVGPQARAAARHLAERGSYGDYHTWSTQLALLLHLLP